MLSLRGIFVDLQIDLILEIVFAFCVLGFVAVLTLTIRNILYEPLSESKRILLTGGPSAGKSSVAAIVADYIRSSSFISYEPLLIPEAATILIKAGIAPKTYDFQKSVFRLQRTMERIIPPASDDSGAVVIQDRSSFDGFSYVPENRLRRFLARNITTLKREKALYENSLILFLESTSGHFQYSCDGVRYENKKEAFERSKKTEYLYQQIFRDRMIFIPAEEDYIDKVRNVLIKVAEYLTGAESGSEDYEKITGEIEKFLGNYNYDDSQKLREKEGKCDG